MDDGGLDRSGTLFGLLGDRLGGSAVEPPVEPWRGLVRALLDSEGTSGKADRLVTALVEADLLEPAALASAEPSELIELARAAGAPLRMPVVVLMQRLSAWADKLGLETLVERPTAALRDSLRGIRGVGPSLADVLLLHGLARVTYPVDRASYRILVRHGWIDPEAGYDEASVVLVDLAPEDPARLADLSAALRQVARRHCKARAALCGDCPLRPMLPPGGPVEAHDHGD